jgi:hypothetical protein
MDTAEADDAMWLEPATPNALGANGRILDEVTAVGTVNATVDCVHGRTGRRLVDAARLRGPADSSRCPGVRAVGSRRR